MATIALDNLKPQEQLKLSPFPQDTTDYASIINSAVGNPIELDKQVQEQETLVQSSLNTLSNLMQEGAGIGSQQLAMENQAGISQQQKEVQDLTNQLNAIRTQANVIPMQIQQESAGRGRTEAGIAPLQTAELRNNAIQALTVGAQLQAKQGNLALAQSQIDRAIELKYRDIENRTRLAELNYNRNKETLERIDKKRADALGYAIQKQKEKDAENKANEMAIQNMIVEATPTAPASVIANARKLAESGASRLAVAQSLGVYGGDYLKNELLREQIKTEQSKRAQVDVKTSLLTPQSNGAITAPNGDAIGLPISTLSAIGNLKMNEGQANAVAFVSRMIQADKAIQQQLGQVKPQGGFYETTGYDPTSLGSGIGRLVGSDASRIFDRNKEDFIRAKLRKESGAVISPEEMEQDSKIYTPAGVGLDEKDLLQAQVKRDEAIKAMISQAGPAAPYLLQYYQQSKNEQFVVPQGVSSQASSYAQSTMGTINNVNSQVNTQQAYSGYDTGVKK